MCALRVELQRTKTQENRHRVKNKRELQGLFIPPFSGIVKQAERPYLQEALEGQKRSTAILYLQDEGGAGGKLSHEEQTWMGAGESSDSGGGWGWGGC